MVTIPRWIERRYRSDRRRLEILREVRRTSYGQRVLAIYRDAVALYFRIYNMDNKRIRENYDDLKRLVDELGRRINEIVSNIGTRYNERNYPQMWRAILGNIYFRTVFTSERLSGEPFWSYETPVGRRKILRSYWRIHPFLVEGNLSFAIGTTTRLIQDLRIDLIDWGRPIEEILYIRVERMGIFEYWITKEWDYKINMETPIATDWPVTGERDPRLGIRYGIKLRGMMMLSIGEGIDKTVFGRRWMDYRERRGRRLIYDPDKLVSVASRKVGNRIRATIDFSAFADALPEVLDLGRIAERHRRHTVEFVEEVGDKE